MGWEVGMGAAGGCGVAGCGGGARCVAVWGPGAGGPLVAGVRPPPLPGAAVLLGQRHAEQTELARAAEQRVVERLVAVVLGRLRLDLARDERLERLGEQRVLG